jgi:hypothetical protein
MTARLTDLGGTVLTGSPAHFGKLIADETEKWGKVIRAANSAEPNEMARPRALCMGRLAAKIPMTGIVGCCARAASGHAAAPPSSAMNSRRFV